MINVKKYFNHNPITLFNILFQRSVAYCLQKKYKFDKWHIHAVPSLRTYRKHVVNFILDKYNKEVIVDFACGLGYLGIEIDKKSKSSIIYGYDISVEVIAAAKILADLNKSRIKYIDNYEMVKKISKKSDVVFCLNFMHELDKKNMEEIVLDLIPDNGILVADSVKDKDKGYKFFHDFKDISGVRIIEKFNVPGESRDFNVIIKG